MLWLPWFCNNPFFNWKHFLLQQVKFYTAVKVFSPPQNFSPIKDLFPYRETFLLPKNFLLLRNVSLFKIIFCHWETILPLGDCLSHWETFLPLKNFSIKKLFSHWETFLPQRNFPPLISFYFLFWYNFILGCGWEDRGWLSSCIYFFLCFYILFSHSQSLYLIVKTR